MLLLITLPVLPVSGVVPEGGKEQLRRLIKLPEMVMAPGLEFFPATGFRMLAVPREELLSQTTKLIQELTGTPSDASRYLRLGELRLALGESTAARLAFESAAVLYDQEVEMQPGNGLLLAELGRALAGNDQQERAASVLRKSVRVSPEAWETWAGLGRFLEGESLRILQGSLENNLLNLRSRAWVGEMLRLRPSWEQMTHAETLLMEAGECFDRAVLLSPGEMRVYQLRGRHRALEGLVLETLSQARKLERNGEKGERAQFNEGALADFKEAARLGSRSTAVLLEAAFYEVMVAMLEESGGLSTRTPLWARLPESAQRSVREIMTELEGLAQSPQRKVAADALESLGMIQMALLGDAPAAAWYFRRALLSDATREKSWELLTTLLARPGRYDEMLDVCQKRLAEKATIRNRLLLAQAHFYLDQFGAAEDQARKALRMNVDNVPANLVLGVLLLKRSESPWAAREYLNKVDQTRAKTRQERIDLILALSIFHGLADNVEEARRLVRIVLNSEGNNRYAREISAVLER